MKVLTGNFLLVAGALAGLSGCASIGPPEAPSLEVPKPPEDVHVARKGDKVTLTWTIPPRTTERQSVRYLGETDICRGFAGELKRCDTRVGQAAPPADFEKTRGSAGKKPVGKKLTGTFVDTLPFAIEQEQPTGFATYAVEVMNTAGRGAGISNQVRVPLVPTLPPFGNFAAQLGNQGVTISWECPGGSSKGGTGVRYLLRIYRRLESSAGETKIAEVEATECAVGPSGQAVTSFLDQTLEWEKTYFYRGAVVSVIEQAGKPAVEVEGDDTPSVKVFAHDVFPPAVPTGLQAVFSGPGQEAFIDLIWAPVMDADLEGYNVYRHEEGGQAVKLNTGLVKTPAFRDARVMAGKTYFYSVSAVDQRGNESARSEETSESVP
jgi:hypothetical protein